MNLKNISVQISKLSQDLIEAKKTDDEELVASLEDQIIELEEEMEAVELDMVDEKRYHGEM